MALLQVMPEDQPERALLRTTNAAAIASTLEPHGILFSRWELALHPGTYASGDEILKAYSAQVGKVKEHGGYRLVDVAQLRPDDTDPSWPKRAAKARAAFLNEHRHAEDEVRFFAAGLGCFYLHIDHKVFAAVCEAGDLLSVPAGTLHWFDMGARPDFAAIRFFQKEDGWIGDFTGNQINSVFPTVDLLLQGAP